MATRRRDYKAEYARAKARATAAGYKSEREYKQARKRLGVHGGRVSPVPKRVLTAIVDAGADRDRAARAWSKRHSKVRESAWSDSFDESQRAAYFNIYVKPSRNRAKWKTWQHDFLVPEFYSEEEYNERYNSTGASTAVA